MTPIRLDPIPARVVRVGSTHSCGVTTGDQTFCWGAGEVGQLGNGTETTPSATPVRVAGGLLFSGLSADGRSTCGVTPHNRALCWGINDAGQLGNGTSTGPEQCAPAEIPCSTKPVAVVGGLRFRQVDVGGSHACGVTTANVAYCWGDNTFGQLGDGTTTQRLRPVPVAGSDIHPHATEEATITNNQVGVDQSDGDARQE